MEESRNYTEEDRKFHLETLQSQTILVMIPTLIFLSLLMVTGVIGNSLVLLIYWRKHSKTPENVFILVVAVYDLLTNAVTIPGEIYMSLNYWDYDNPTICRIQQHLNTTVVIGSGLMLVVIALTRYRKICQPFKWQVSIQQAKIVTAVIFITCLLCAIPYDILNGRQTKLTPRPGIHGYMCEIDDAYLKTIWPMLNSIFFILIFVFGSIPMLILYSLIGRIARRHGTISLNTNETDNSRHVDVSNEIITKSTNDSIVSCSADESTTQNFKENLMPVNDVINETLSGRSDYRFTREKSLAEVKSGRCLVTGKHFKTSPEQKIKNKGLGRTTSMLLAVSLVFVLSFLPFLALELLKAVDPDAFKSMGLTTLSFFHLFHSSFLINPIIYSVCNIKFRQECLRLFTCF